MNTPFEGKHADVTGKIIQAFFAVYNQLGYGFLEKVYGNAAAHEATKLGLHVVPQKEILVYSVKSLTTPAKALFLGQIGRRLLAQNKKSVFTRVHPCPYV